MSIAQFATLIVCPSHIAQAAKASRMGLSILVHSKAFLDTFSAYDAAFLIAFNQQPVLDRYFGERTTPLVSNWFNEPNSAALLGLSKAASVTSQINDQYLQEPSPDNNQDLFSVEDLGNGMVILIVHPGCIFSLRNDNYLMNVLRSVVKRMFGFVSLDKLLNDQSSIVKRFLNLAAFNNPNRPPEPVFA